MHSTIFGIYTSFINCHLNNICWKLSNQTLQIFRIGSHLHLQNHQYFLICTGNFSPTVPGNYICPLFAVVYVTGSCIYYSVNKFHSQVLFLLLSLFFPKGVILHLDLTDGKTPSMVLAPNWKHRAKTPLIRCHSLPRKLCSFKKLLSWPSTVAPASSVPSSMLHVVPYGEVF